MLKPITPAPTTIVFGRCDETIFDALMTDSLHRACPARFSGSDLSRRPCRQTPAPPGNTPASSQFQADLRGDARIFSETGVLPTGFVARRATAPRVLHLTLSKADAINLLVR